MKTHSDPAAPLQPIPPGEQAASAAAVRPIPPGSHEEVFFHLDLLRSLRLHRRLATAIVAAGLAIAVAYVLRTWPIYTAESLVYIQPAPPRMMENAPNQRWPFDENTYESYMQQQVNNVTRADVLLGALNKLPAGAWRQPDETEGAAVERLGRAIKVEREGAGYQISISAHASDSALAAQIANAVASSFVDTARNDLRAGDPQRIQLLREERDRIQKALSDDRVEQDALNRTLGVATVGATTPDPYDAQINQTRIELAKARAAHDEAGARLTMMNTANATSSAALDAEADDIVAADPGLVSMKQSLNQRRALLISQMANLTANHPQYKQDEDELAKINVSVENMQKDLRARASAHLQQRLRNDLEQTSALEAKLNAQIAQLASAAGSSTPRMQRASDLATDIQRLQNRFTVVDEQFRNLTMENKAPGAAFVSAPASPPRHATNTPILRKAATVLFGALLLAVIAAVGAHNLDPRIYIAADVERVLGLSPMAQLPDFRQVSDGVGEEYMLRLAGAIEHAYQQGGLKSCIFTGVGTGAGVTTLATRVTAMLEGMGRSTVLVDASGTVPEPAPDETAEGTTDLVTTGRDNRPSTLLQQMAEEMDTDTIVLTDTAPLLACGETEYLARFVDSAIVVIQSGLTTRAQLREVAQTLQRLEVAAVGFVLNRVAIEKANPSFRQSVRAVERRLELQNRSHARRQGRGRSSAQHGHETVQEPSAVTEPDAAPSPSPDTAGRPSTAPGMPATPRAAATPSSAAPSRPASPSSPAQTPRTARGRGEPARPVAPPSPAAVPMAAETPVPASVAAEPASVPKVHLPVAETGAPAQGARAYEQKSPPVRPPVEKMSAPPHPNRAPEPRTRPAPAPEPRASNASLPLEDTTDEHDSAYRTASRLGGLRNLLVTLGRKSLTRETEEPEFEPRFERATMRPAYGPSHQPVENSDDASGSSPIHVTAQPEFLPPKPVVEVEREKEQIRPPAAPRNNVDNQDDIQTLPSWRGQYRKKRYPPI